MQKTLGSLAVKIVPLLLTLMMPILLAALTHIFFISQIMPLLVIVGIYYWCMFLPGSLPYSFLFILGILQDTLTGAPLGFSSFMNVMLAWIVLHRFHVVGGMSFATIWLRFIAVCLAAVILEWCIMSIYYDRMLPVQLSVLKLISTCFAYPIVHLWFARVQNVLNRYS
jgi:rod shape-determining protein MreD